MMLLLAVAVAQDATVVAEGTTEPIDGPAVVLSPQRFRRYVADSRDLEACEVRELQLHDVAVDLRERLGRAATIGTDSIDGHEAREAEHLALVEDLGKRLDGAERRARLAGPVGVAVGVGLTLGAAWAVGQVVP